MTRILPSLVFNELSAYEHEHTLAADRATALKWMNSLVQILREADKRGIRSFRTPKGFLSLILYMGYTPRHWLQDRTYDVSLDVQDFLRDYVTSESIIEYNKVPPGSNVSHRLQQNFFSEYDGRAAEGLGFAYRLNMVALSFPSAEHWDVEQLELECLEDQDDGTCEYVLSHVKHAMSIAHLNIHHLPRFYHRNPKHPIQADEEAFIARMDLMDDQAQEALLMGVQPDGLDEVYSYYDGGYYVFRPTRANVHLYHGYRVKSFRPQVENNVLKALRAAGLID